MKLNPSTRAANELRQARMALEAAQTWHDAKRSGPEAERDQFLARHALTVARQRVVNAEAAVAALGGK